MNLQDYDDQPGKKVWLSDNEVDQLLAQFEDGSEQLLAASIAVRCGLRSAEVLDVAPEHIADTDAGTMLRVWDGAKNGGYRETPIPDNLATTIRTIGHHRDASTDAPVVDVSTRTLRRWISTAADQLADETGDPGWNHVGMHDLRRTWATSLRSADVDAMVVCDWGGWDDLQTFLDHYRGTHSPEAQKRERQKVDWL